MKHSFVLWDCCFRNFFHLTGSLAAQDFPCEEYEIIWVEQRTRAASDTFNRPLGLPSLGETVERYAGVCQVRVLYLDHPPEQPYHLGIALNAGMAAARGEIVSCMDGDMLVRPDFVASLGRAHAELGCVLNLARRRAPHAVGVPPERWTEGIIDFELCLDANPRGRRQIPESVTNKGPCISAPRQWWQAVGGYDEHPLWATGISRAGQDVNARMEIFSGQPSRALPDQLAVHPWHPQGLNRSGEIEGIIFAAQQRLIDWSLEHREPTLPPRDGVLAEVYDSCRDAVKENQST